MKLAIIGGGNMGAAYGACFLEKGLVESGGLQIIENRKERRDELALRLRCCLEAEPGALWPDADIVILAVKPQDMQKACEACLPRLSTESLVVSIMAGVTLARLSELLGGHKKLARCMPNMPVQIGAGMTVYVPFPGLAENSCGAVEKLLGATGACLRLQSEDLINAATALSGSGPGYIFYLLEHVLNAARDLGFSSEEAETLVAQTVSGALMQWRRGSCDAAVLRAMVTSKGGTTAAALEVFERGKVGETLAAGIIQAYQRSVELGK